MTKTEYLDNLFKEKVKIENIANTLRNNSTIVHLHSCGEITLAPILQESMKIDSCNIFIKSLTDYINSHSFEIKEYIINELKTQIKQKIVDTKPIIEELLQQTIDIEKELNNR